MNEAEKERLKEIFRISKGIVDHEFSQEVIDACQPYEDARHQRRIGVEVRDHRQRRRGGDVEGVVEFHRRLGDRGQSHRGADLRPHPEHAVGGLHGHIGPGHPVAAAVSLAGVVVD